MPILNLLLKEDQIFLWKLPRLYDQLELTVRNSDTERARISPLLSLLLAQRGTIADGLEMISNHLPHIDDEGANEINQRLMRISGPMWEGLMKENPLAGPASFGHSAFPTKQFIYPKGPRVSVHAIRLEFSHSYAYLLERGMG